MVTTKHANNPHHNPQPAPLRQSPSELRVQRLRNILTALQRADQQLQQQVYALAFAPLSPPSAVMSGRRLQPDVAPPSPADRVRLGRELGNQYLRQYAPQRSSTTTYASSAQSRSNDAAEEYGSPAAGWTASAIQRGRDFGNNVSRQNANSGTRTAQGSEAALAASNRVEEYGAYCRLRNRLVLLEQRRAQLMQMYGKDDVLDEYTELLERCWQYESTHANVEPFATAKIVRVLEAMPPATDKK